MLKVAVLALMMSVASAPEMRAQGQTAPRKGYQVLRVFPERFTCEYPAKDWDIVAGGASSLVTVSQKKREATIVIEYQPMQLELAPSEIDDTFAKLEAEPIGVRQSGVTGLSTRILDVNGHRAIVIEYSRRGATGPEHVRQYSLPIGKHLYRVIGSAPNGNFERYAPTFEVAALSFAVAGAPAAAPAAPKR
jgi:hypothetical protein